MCMPDPISTGETMPVENLRTGLPENQERTDARWRRSFWSLIVTQFQGAYSDNAYKYLVIFLISALGLLKSDRDQFVFIVGALFAIPFILFSMAGGYLADRYSKRSVTGGTKAAGILIMLLALVALRLDNLTIALGAVFLLSTQSAFFRPSKYGL